MAAGAGPRPYADAHTHLADARFDAVRGEWLERAGAAGLGRFVLASAAPADWDAQERLATEKPETFVPTLGLHPWWVVEQDDAAIDDALGRLRERAAALPQGAIGEAGIDHWDRFPPESYERQSRAFEGQLRIARELSRPIVLHVVRAHDEALGALGAASLGRGGIVHAFSGPIEAARGYRDLGLLISAGQALLRPGYKGLKTAVAELGLDELAVESDDAEPASVVGVAAEIARLRTLAGKPCSAEDVLAAGAANVARVFFSG